MKHLLFFAGMVFAATASAASSTMITINTNLPGTSTVSGASGVCGVVANFYSFALMMAGILAFGAIVYGGIKYAVGRGNPTSESEGKSWVTNALLGLLLLAGAWIILYTVNPQIVTCQGFGLPALREVPAGPAGGPTGGPAPTSTAALCTDLASTARGNNEPYPATTAPEVNTLIACLHANVSFGAPPSVPQWTYDVDHPTCNYTRGRGVCDAGASCSHAINSCHYGGKTGTQGALAVDFSITGATAQQIVDAAYASCGIPSGGYPKARCEAASGVQVPCVGGGATHVHISAASCDSN